MKNEKMTEEGEGRFLVESGKKMSLWTGFRKGKRFLLFFIPGTIGGAIMEILVCGDKHKKNIFERQKYLTYTKKFRNVSADFFRFEHQRTLFISFSGGTEQNYCLVPFAHIPKHF